MREKSLIKEGSPCDIDFLDKDIQSLSDAKKKGQVFCPNLKQCLELKTPIGCSRRIAQEMADFILERLESNLSLEEAIQREKEDYLRLAPAGELWVCRNGKWQVVQGEEGNVVEDIVAFALIILDRQPCEQRPFTKEGLRIPEMGPSEAINNALIDLDNVYGEVGQKNPFR